MAVCSPVGFRVEVSWVAAELVGAEVVLVDVVVVGMVTVADDGGALLGVVVGALVADAAVCVGVATSSRSVPP